MGGAMSIKQEQQILILGIGNVLWADEGFGVRAVEALQQRFQFPDNVQLLDGGTQGLYLLQHVQCADVLVVLDAIDYGLAPGALKSVRDGDVPSYLGAKKMSLHQTGFQEVLATAEMLGDHPEHLLLIGVQPEELEDYGGSLRPLVRAQIDPAIQLVLDFLKQFGIEPQPRNISNHELSGLALSRYEQERPSAEAALRLGDPRIVLNDAYEIVPLSGLSDAICVDVDHRGKY
jgi:hydrogenase maturation protease